MKFLKFIIIQFILIKIEPSKAFKFKKTKQLNKVIEHTIKSQINDNSSVFIIKKGSKALLEDNFSKKGNNLKQKFNKKGCYTIPIIIDSSIGGTRYKFQVAVNINGLEKGNFYIANYRLIKFFSNEVWEKFVNNM